MGKYRIILFNSDKNTNKDSLTLNGKQYSNFVDVSANSIDDVKTGDFEIISYTMIRYRNGSYYEDETAYTCNQNKVDTRYQTYLFRILIINSFKNNELITPDHFIDLYKSEVKKRIDIKKAELRSLGYKNINDSTVLNKKSENEYNDICPINILYAIHNFRTMHIKDALFGAFGSKDMGPNQMEKLADNLEFNLEYKPEIVDLDKFMFLTDKNLFFISDSDMPHVNPVIKALINKYENIVKRDEYEIMYSLKTFFDQFLVRDRLESDSTMISRVIIEIDKLIKNARKNLDQESSELFKTFLDYKEYINIGYIAHNIMTGNNSVKGLYEGVFGRFDPSAGISPGDLFRLAYNKATDFAKKLGISSPVADVIFNPDSYSFDKRIITTESLDEKQLSSCSAESLIFGDIGNYAWGMAATITLDSKLNPELAEYNCDSIERGSVESVKYLIKSLSYPIPKRRIDGVLRSLGVSIEQYIRLHEDRISDRAKDNLFDQLDKIYTASMDLCKANRGFIGTKNIKVIVSLLDKRINDLLNRKLNPNDRVKVFYSGDSDSITYEKFYNLWDIGMQKSSKSEMDIIRELNDRIRSTLLESSDTELTLIYGTIYLRNIKMLTEGSLSIEETFLLASNLKDLSKHLHGSNIEQMLKITCNYYNNCKY